jgi:heptosyltransferase I
VILAGGPSEVERQMGVDIERACRAPLINQIGKDTLPELLALLARARLLVTPDSGPAHMATMVGTPVVGLYAATNPARSGPYLSGRWCVNAYAEAARVYRGVEPEELPWTHKIEEPGVMELIRVAEVNAKIDELLASPHA